jgi:signal transduction histidine kinase
VTIGYSDSRLDLEILDDGAGGEVAGPGRGIIGMRERVGLLGGQLSAGPRASGGFGVRVMIPLRGAA